MEKKDIKKYAQDMIEKELFSVVFAQKQQDRTEEKTKEFAKQIDSADGIACFTNPETGQYYWGILVNSGKIAKSNLTKEKQEEENA